MVVAGASAQDLDPYQTQINLAFPGYRIVPKPEFAQNIQQRISNPSIVTGIFAEPDTPSFATLIRSNTERKLYLGKKEYRYFDGKLVVCREKFNCQEISSSPLRLPLNEYLQKEKAGESICFERHSIENRLSYDAQLESITVVTDYGNTIVWLRTDNGTFVPCIKKLRSREAHEGGKYRVIKEDLDKPERPPQ